MSSSPQILVNGKDSQTIEATDRGLAYGDGVFETIAITNQRPEFWSRHMARLQQGCQVLHIPPPDPETLARQTAHLCSDVSAEGPQSRAVIKIIVTRGSGGRGYKPPPDPDPTVIVARYPWPSYPPEWGNTGVCVRLCQTRLSHQPALAGIKHLNRLEAVLARSEWDDPDIAEGLLCDSQGSLIEAVMSNLFFVIDHSLITPDLRSCGVAGIMRDVILDLARELGIKTIIRDVALCELETVESLFLTNSLIGIWPVRQIAKRALSVSPLIERLQTALATRRTARYSLNSLQP